MDQEIVDVLREELETDEQILWAEKTNHQRHEINKKAFGLTIIRANFYKASLLITSVILLSILIFAQTPYPWLLSFMADILLYTVLGLGVILSLNMLVKHRTYNTGAYALTNKRLFELDYEFKVVKSIDASRVKHVSGSEGVRLKPIGAKGNKSYQLGMMKNSTLTINHLHGKITKARSATQ